MENIEIFLSYIAIILSLVASTITFIIKFIKCIKDKKDTLNLLNLSNVVIPLIEEAEKFINFTKEEKKEYVLVKTLKALQEEKITIDTNVISEEIEKLVALTKKVNVKNTKELKSYY